jgi:hypothetical protein
MNHRNRLQTPTPHIGKILTTLFFALALTISLVNKLTATPVEYNPAGSPVPVKEMERAITLALWEWSSRIELDSEYIGTTGENEAAGKIIIQWVDLPMLTESGNTLLVGNVTRWAGQDKAVIRLNRNLMFTSVDECLTAIFASSPQSAWDCFGDKFVYNGGQVSACLLELIGHELAHVLVSWEHSPYPGDVMYPYRDDCRYSPSMSDLQLSGKPVKSCHVELTPEGNLEYLDYNGSRISLKRTGEGTWTWGSVQTNPSPTHCDGIFVQAGEVWAEVKGFGRKPTILRLKQENGIFRSIPFLGNATDF